MKFKLFLFSFFFSTVLIAQTEPSIPKSMRAAPEEGTQNKIDSNVPNAIRAIPSTAEVYKVVKQMPVMFECSDLVGEENRQKCSEDVLLEALYKSLKYPEEAREKKIDGMVVLQFIVEINGEISDLNIVRDIGGGCGSAAMEALKDLPKWAPGEHNGRKVRILRTLPVRFKL